MALATATIRTYPSADETKLAGVETGAQADQTGAEIKTAYEAEASAYTDTKDTKLTGIEAGADVNPADLDGVPDSATRKAMLDTEREKLGDVEKGARNLKVVSDWVATTAYIVGDIVLPTTPNNFLYECIVAGSSGASEPVWPTTEGNTIVDATVTWKAWAYVSVTLDADKVIDGVTNKVFSATEETKLAGVEDNASADQTGAEIRDAVVALGDDVRKILVTNPASGEHKVYGMRRTGAGDLEYDYNDVAEV